MARVGPFEVFRPEVRPLAATGLDGSPLPPGDYEVRLFMVREGHAIFPEGDQSVVRTLVTVEP